MDFAKAFDRIDHRILLTKLSELGFSDALVSFFRSYLTDRFQFVTYNCFKSSLYEITSGVPQGSNLGPLFFCLFINDLNDVIGCQKLFFADDLKIFSSIISIDDCIDLQVALDNVVHWCNTNRLNLNISKCKVVTYTRKSYAITYNYQVDLQALVRVDALKDLGVHFDSKLSFSGHVEQIVSSSTRMLGFIIRLSQDFQDKDVLITLFSAYVRSKLEYCSLVWNPIYDCYIKSIESVQRKFLKFLIFRIDGRYPTEAVIISIY